MNSKKIWMWSLVFGVVSALLLYLALFPSPPPTPEPEEPEVVREQPIEEPNVATLPLQLAPGMRAVSIPVNEVQGLSGYLTPDLLVDVVITVPALQGGDVASQLVLQRKRVLSVGNQQQHAQQVEERGEGEEGEEQDDVEPVEGNNEPIDYELVTLEVTPWEGTALALAVEQGSIYLMLRSTEDPVYEPNHRITQDQLYKGVNRK